MKSNQTHGNKMILVFMIVYLFLFGCYKTEDAIDPESIKTWEIFNKGNGLVSDSVWTLAEDAQGNIWVGTMNKGVSKFDGKTWTTYNTDSGLIDNSVLSIAQDGYGSMWFGTRGGLSILSDNKWFNYSSFRSVYAILKDYDDNMWVNCATYPVMRYQNHQWFTYYDYECVLCNEVSVLFEDNQRNIWFGSYEDLKKITSDTTISYTQNDGLPCNYVRAMHQDIWGNIWIATGYCSDVVKFKNGNFEPVRLPNGLRSAIVTSIVSDNNGNVWFGLQYDGIMKYNGSFMEPYPVKNRLPGKSITKIIKDWRGYLWIGTLDGGVARYMPDL